MITHTDNTIFAIVLTAAIFTFGLSVARLVRAIRLGKPDLRLRESLKSTSPTVRMLSPLSIGLQIRETAIMPLFTWTMYSFGYFQDRVISE